MGESCEVEVWEEEGYISEEECCEVGDLHMQEEWEQAEREAGRRCEEAEEAQEKALVEQPYGVAAVVEHQLWEVDELEAMNEVLGGVMQKEVDALKERVKAQELEVEAEESEIRRAAEAGEVRRGGS